LCVSIISSLAVFSPCRALWRGASPSVLRASLLSGSQLASYDTCKRFLRRYDAVFLDADGKESLTLHLLASLFSGFCGQTVAMPADAARTLIMARGSLHEGQHPLQILRRAFRHEGGIRIFYRGYFPALLRQGPVMLVQMPLVERFRLFVGLETI
jgi:solute carrier family 25 uncoupling protein 8/9